VIPIIMPQVGQDIPSAVIIEWRKGEGDRVEKGEVVLVVESDKAVFEVEAEESGLLLKVLHGEGEEVDILQPVAYVGRPGEKPPTEPDERGVPEAAQAGVDGDEELLRDLVELEPEPDEELRRARSSPAARRVARERGIEVAEIEGTGPGGRVIKRDVVAAAAVGDRTVPFSKMRRRIAQRLSLSAQTIPHFYLSVDVDMTAAQAWRRELNAEGEVHVTVTDLVIRATASLLREFGRLNAHVQGDALTLKEDVNVGVAVALEAGLLVPVIPRADEKTLEQISRISKENADAAREGVLTPSAAGTFTVSSMGMWGVRDFRPIINPPECGILAVGAVEKRVVPVEGAIAVREVMTLTLGCDHRAVDGAYAARFLAELKDYLQNMHQTEAHT
jgi:pyruvate dehydrogenase E2 component (dihydrolipoamide acetyltransferase)